MKKSLLFLPFAAVILVGCGNVSEAKAEEPIGTKIQNLIKDYIDENGQYTKKTTICFNEEAHKEMDKYFHNGAVQAERTTYYDDDDETLLMADPLGNLDLKDKYTDSGYGGYRLDKDAGKIYRFVAKNTDGTFENMFNTEYMYTKSVASYSNKTHLSDAFVNLSKLAADGYFADKDWEYSSQYKQYTHDVNHEEGKTENNDRYYPDILGFAAPMLKSNYVGSNYLHIQSIGFSEHYDADANKYLSIKIYLINEDKDKLNGERGDTTMSEARIYKGIRPVGKEDFSEGYFLRVWNENNTEKSMTKLLVNTENETELYTTNVAMGVNDHAKLWSTKRGFDIAEDYKYSHNLSIGVPTNDAGDYVAKNAGTYDFYAKFTDSSLATYESTWVNMNEVRTIYLENNWYKESTDFKIYYWGGEGVTGTEWDSAPSLVWDSYTGKDIYRAVIPGNVQKVIFRHANWDGATQTVDITLGTNNAYYFDHIENSKTVVGSYMK